MFPPYCCSLPDAEDGPLTIDMVACWRADTRNPSVETFVSELTMSSPRRSAR